MDPLSLSLTFALRRATELIGVSKHIVKGYLGNTRELLIANVTIQNGAPSRVQPTNNLTC